MKLDERLKTEVEKRVSDFYHEKCEHKLCVYTDKYYSPLYTKYQEKYFAVYNKLATSSEDGFISSLTNLMGHAILINAGWDSWLDFVPDWRSLDFDIEMKMRSLAKSTFYKLFSNYIHDVERQICKSLDTAKSIFDCDSMSVENLDEIKTLLEQFLHIAMNLII